VVVVDEWSWWWLKSADGGGGDGRGGKEKVGATSIMTTE